MTECPSDEVALALDEAVLWVCSPDDAGNITSYRGLFCDDTGRHGLVSLLSSLELTPTTSLTLLFLLLIGCGLCLLRLEGLFEVLGRFVGFAFVVHCYLGLVSFGHGFDFLLPLLLLGVVLEEARPVLFLIHTDVGVEMLTFLVDYVLEVEGAS